MYTSLKRLIAVLAVSQASTVVASFSPKENKAPAAAEGIAAQQLHTDHRYRNIGVPFNQEINIKDAPKKEVLDRNCWLMSEFSDVVVTLSICSYPQSRTE
ncbi:MAG: hypothetical protein WAS21_01295 [Geminicoccaceae bacterium]